MGLNLSFVIELGEHELHNSAGPVLNPSPSSLSSIGSSRLALSWSLLHGQRSF